MKSFTLIEVLVVTAIFSIVVGAISGVFVTGISSQRKILAEQEILNQISYVLEYMGRAIRMAKKDDIPIGGQTNDCIKNKYYVNYEVSSDQSKIIFRNYQNQCQSFYLSSTQIFEQIDENSPLPLTSPNLKINSLKFKVSGETQDDKEQPRVTIFIEVEKGKRNLKFQTTISQRDLDVP